MVEPEPFKKQSKYEKYVSQVDPKILEEWKTIQNDLKAKLIETDKHSFTINTDPNTDLSVISGMDISASVVDPSVAVSAFVICDKDLNVLYEHFEFVKVTEPYVPGFLAFREVSHLVRQVEFLKKVYPDFMPQVILCDGNGIFHSNRFGLACHLGVLVDIPTIGCSKTVFAVDGINKKNVNAQARKLKKGGDYVFLTGDSGNVWGAALKSTKKSSVPMIISIGHRVSLQTALDVVKSTTKFRVPEPVRLADKKSRWIIEEFERRNEKFDIVEWLKNYKDDEDVL